MLIIDGHLDLAWNAIQGNRNLLQSVYTIRTREQGLTEKGRGLGTVALPEMRQGRIALSIVTLFGRSTGSPVFHADYGSPTQSYGAAHGHLAYYRALEQGGHTRIITGRAGQPHGGMGSVGYGDGCGRSAAARLCGQHGRGGSDADPGQLENGMPPAYG